MRAGRLVARWALPLAVLYGLAFCLVRDPVAWADESGHIQIQAPAGVAVYLDGTPRGTTSQALGGLLLTNVLGGTHKLRFEASGMEPKEATVEVSPGKVTVYKVSLKAPPPTVSQEGKAAGGELRTQRGRLNISSLPIECLLDVPAAELKAYRKIRESVRIDNVPAGMVEVRGKALGVELLCAFTLPPGEECQIFLNFADKTVTGPKDGYLDTVRKHAAAKDWDGVDFALAVGRRFGLGPADLSIDVAAGYREWLKNNGPSKAAQSIGSYLVQVKEVGVSAAFFSRNDDHSLGNGHPELYLIIKRNGVLALRTRSVKDQDVVRSADLGSPQATLSYVPGDTLEAELWDEDAWNDDRLCVWTFRTTRDTPGFPLSGRHKSEDGGAWVEMSATREP